MWEMSEMVAAGPPGRAPSRGDGCISGQLAATGWQQVFGESRYY